MGGNVCSHYGIEVEFVILTVAAYTIGQSTRNLLLGEYSNTNADGPRVSWAQNLRSAVGISTILPGYNKWVDSSFVGVAA